LLIIVHRLPGKKPFRLLFAGIFADKDLLLICRLPICPPLSDFTRSTLSGQWRVLLRALSEQRHSWQGLLDVWAGFLACAWLLKPNSGAY
jgi:hypothetical protein